MKTVDMEHHLKPGIVDEHGCIKDQNDIAKEFNKQLKERVIKLRAELPQAALTYVDIYSAKYKLISNARDLGNYYLIFKIIISYIINNKFKIVISLY